MSPHVWAVVRDGRVVAVKRQRRRAEVLANGMRGAEVLPYDQQRKSLGSALRMAS